MNDPKRASAQTTPFDACLQQAAAGGDALLGRLVAAARQSLHQRAGVSDGATERTALIESLQLLTAQEARLREAYPLELMTAFTEALRGRSTKAAGANAISFDQLELMDETQVQESVETARAQQAVMLAAETELAEFNAVICAAQGLKTVQADRNPLRPETYVKALQAAIAKTGVAAAIRVRWMQHLGTALGKELGRTYEELALELRLRGIGSAAYAVTTTPQAGGEAAAARAQNDVRLTVDQLRRLLSGELSPPGAPTASPAPAAASRFPDAKPSEFQHTVPAAFETLREMKQVDTVMQRIARRQTAGQTSTGDERDNLRRTATSLGQSLGLEVVNLMVDNLATDARLLPPVQEAVRQLEPALMRLALKDPRFFSDRQHPARALLEQVTQRSLAFRTESDPGFGAFMLFLRAEVSDLANDPIEDPTPFARALQTLELRWDDQERQEKANRDRAVQALLHAEHRKLLADTFAREFRNQHDLAQLPTEVVEFICGPWGQVVAEARISDGNVSVDPKGYLAVVDDLLWSIRADLSRTDLTRLSQLIPDLLARLRSGLQGIDYPAARSKAFFEALMALHEQALKPPRAFARRAKALVQTTREQLEARFAADDDRLWLAPEEVKDSGFLDSRSMLPDPVHFEPTRPSFYSTFASEAPPSKPAVEGLDSPLAIGSWVELHSGGRWQRTRLTWQNPQGTMFVFTGLDGSTHSMTRRVLDIRLAAGAVRVMDRAVVDSALDAVAKLALANSIDVTL